MERVWGKHTELFTEHWEIESRDVQEEEWANTVSAKERGGGNLRGWEDEKEVATGEMKIILVEQDYTGEMYSEPRAKYEGEGYGKGEKSASALG